MKVTAIQIRPGHVVEHEGRHYVVLKNTILQPGKGGAFVQVDMRDVKSGNKMNHRWRTQENVERARVDEVEASALFLEGDDWVVMDQTTYEQHRVPRSLLGDGAAFLRESMEVTLSFIDGALVSARPPLTVTAGIAECEPVVKGQTASSSYKPAVLDNGVRLMVPPHIGVGDQVVVNTVECSYMERAK